MPSSACKTLTLFSLAVVSNGFQSSQNSCLRSQYALDSRTGLTAVTDPITLLGNAEYTNIPYIETSDGNLGKERLIVIDASAGSSGLQQVKPAKARIAGNRRQNKKKTRKVSRSSTMPGYATKNTYVPTEVKRIEDETGRDLGQLHKSEEVQQRRKTHSGEALYQASASVPESLVQFAKELHQEERITPTEELELGRLTQEAIRLQSLFDDLENQLDREPTDEEWCAAAGKINMEAISQALEEGLEAKNKLVTSNLRMVQRVVNVYIRNGLSGQYNAGDMMQEGVMALIRAAEKFEPQRGFRFSTYAMYWIRSAVKRSQLFQSRIIPLPQRLHANHKRIKLAQREMQQSLGRPPTMEELMKAVDMSEGQLKRCIRAMDQRCYSLDQTIVNRNKPNLDNSRQDSLYDILDTKAKDSTDGSSFYSMNRVLMREDLVESIYRILDRESAHIVMLRYGLVEDTSVLPEGFRGPLTIAQVSQLVGMKPDKVRRRILRSLDILKYSIGQEWNDI